MKNNKIKLIIFLTVTIVIIGVILFFRTNKGPQTDETKPVIVTNQKYEGQKTIVFSQPTVGVESVKVANFSFSGIPDKIRTYGIKLKTINQEEAKRVATVLGMGNNQIAEVKTGYLFNNNAGGLFMQNNQTPTIQYSSYSGNNNLEMLGETNRDNLIKNILGEEVKLKLEKTEYMKGEGDNLIVTDQQSSTKTRYSYSYTMDNGVAVYTEKSLYPIKLVYAKGGGLEQLNIEYMFDWSGQVNQGEYKTKNAQLLTRSAGMIAIDMSNMEGGEIVDLQKLKLSNLDLKNYYLGYLYDIKNNNLVPYIFFDGNGDVSGATGVNVVVANSLLE